MGELANTLKGWNGGECANRMEARPTRPTPRGSWRNGGQAAEWPCQPEGRRGAAPRGERGPAVSSAAPVETPRCFPLRFPPFGVFEFEGGIRKGGFQRGETDGGKQR